MFDSGLSGETDGPIQGVSTVVGGSPDRLPWRFPGVRSYVDVLASVTACSIRRPRSVSRCMGYPLWHAAKSASATQGGLHVDKINIAIGAVALVLAGLGLTFTSSGISRIPNVTSYTG